MKKIYNIALALAIGFGITACSDDDDYSIRTGNIVTEITTGNAFVTAVSADIEGTVKDLSKVADGTYVVGVVYGQSVDVTSSGTKVTGSVDAEGNISATLSGLADGESYYYATFVTLQNTVSYYGEVKQFVSTDALVTTLDATNITACHATLNAQFQGIDESIKDQVVYGYVTGETVEEVTDMDGFAIEFDEPQSCESEGWCPGIKHYYVAYMRIGDGIIMGEPKEFTTKEQVMEYVDMGCSVLWAKYNVGAEALDEDGDNFYAENASWIMENIHYDGTSKMSSTIPTAAQYEELLSKTTQKWTGDGLLLTAANGNTLFFPAAGYATDAATWFNEGTSGYYWTSTQNPTDADYYRSFTFSESSAAVGVAQKDMVYNMRTVRQEEPVEEGIAVRNYNAVQGDIENNGNYRFDIFNQWDGSGTGTDETSVVLASDVSFTESISVTFSITGTQGGSYQAFMCFADGTWATSNWGYNENGEGSVLINGDGTYTMTLHGTGAGLGVFAIDVVGLSAAVGAENVNIKLEKCVMDDWGTKLSFDNSKLVCGDIEQNGNFRADIYNQWDGSGTGDQDHCGVDISAVNFAKRIGVTFEISGIGETSCNAFMCFADGTWATSNWGFNEDGTGSVVINGDGVYSMVLNGTGSGFGVFALDFVGLSNAVGADNVKVRIANIRVE